MVPVARRLLSVVLKQHSEFGAQSAPLLNVYSNG
ncbi:hypothetical protein Vch1786_I2868 [Vibrio cholerae O1 str. 2010EL-1786]|uniref:Uncharacterized protein n=2 Tax=Vibrio cholerae TaxID=666 RepID=Q9KUG6_VIBCH|nr:hypothetical protein VC_0555 [Vibrio cholerae O1 biovar El Tor str. N16961]ACP04838.1 conserved hypothetical protein [Vibrio cholerae M66-2]ACP08591.1 conserved hypothetical protein [Vibrio cholerae O395]AET28388.1 hypothetical protein Vch1786_I2868 [Vibrio cholerae O1 str. 2010EL-1786]CSC10614.1 Uncharacterised protein [Vibrio cholerae]